MSSLSLRSFSACLLIGFSCWLHWPAQAQTPPSSGHDNPSKVKAPPNETGPAWAELSPQQQEVLKPLQQLWPEMEVNRKRKWLAIAKTFPSLNPQAQATAQERMREWAALTPAQRSQARLNFAQSQQLSPDQKLAKWEAYQSLDDESKQNLLKQKQPLPKGAATSPKPIAPEKLPKIETAEVDPRTLLRVKKVKLTEPVDKHE
jgi:hypothetical protein